MVTKEDVIDPSIFEEAYYDQEAIDREIDENAFKLYGKLPMIASASQDFYSILPERILYYQNKLYNFLRSIQNIPGSSAQRYVSMGNGINWEKWKKEELSFIKHLEEVWLVVGPIRSYRDIIVDEEEFQISPGWKEDEDVTYGKSRTIQCVCEMSFVHSDRIRALHDSFDSFLLAYDFRESDAVIRWKIDNIYHADSESECRIPKYKSKENIPDLWSGGIIMSGGLFEKVLWLFDAHSIFEYFEMFPDKVWECAKYIGIQKHEYQVYRLEYFLFHIWYLNESGFWWKLIRYFENVFPDKRRFSESLKTLFLSENIDKELLKLETSPELATPDKQQYDVLEFWDIVFDFTNQTIRIWHSRNIDAKTGKYWKNSVTYDPFYEKQWIKVPLSFEVDEVDITDTDFVRGIKWLWVFVKYGEDFLWFKDVKIYFRWKEENDSIAIRTKNIAGLLPKFMTKKSATEIDQIVNYANKLLDEFNSELTLNQWEQNEHMRKSAIKSDWVLAILAPKVFNKNK